jgi:hypothetical protein
MKLVHRGHESPHPGREMEVSMVIRDGAVAAIGRHGFRLAGPCWHGSLAGMTVFGSL